MTITRLWAFPETQTLEQSKKPCKSPNPFLLNYIPIYSNSRKAAKIAHPDKGGSEAKMALLNEAYEVLSNPELRQRFDNGEDPMDPMTGQGGSPFAAGEHPFAQFFQQGGARTYPGNAGGFQFHFSHGH